MQHNISNIQDNNMDHVKLYKEDSEQYVKNITDPSVVSEIVNLELKHLEEKKKDLFDSIVELIEESKDVPEDPTVKSNFDFEVIPEQK